MKFNVGDLAIPVWNDSQLLVVRTVDPTRIKSGVCEPYLVSRVDGDLYGPIKIGNSHKSYYSKVIWCREEYLRKPEDCQLYEEWQVYQRCPDDCQIEAFNAYEQAVRMLSGKEK